MTIHPWIFQYTWMFFYINHSLIITFKKFKTDIIVLLLCSLYSHFSSCLNNFLQFFLIRCFFKIQVAKTVQLQVVVNVCLIYISSPVFLNLSWHWYFLKSLHQFYRCSSIWVCLITSSFIFRLNTVW